MSLENTQLRTLLTLLRFARSPRRLGPSSLASVVAKVGGDPAVVHRALASLARQGLVLRARDEHETVRLSLPGLAIAVALGAVSQKAKPRASIVARPRLPLERRRRRAA